MQPPGRNMRMREQPITTCQHMATALLPVVASKLATTPYVVRCPKVTLHLAPSFRVTAFLLAHQPALR